MLHHLQTFISIPHITARFIVPYKHCSQDVHFINKNRKKCVSGRKVAHVSLDWGNQRASSPRQVWQESQHRPSSQPGETLQEARAVSASCHCPSNCSVKNKRWHWDICMCSSCLQSCPPGLRTMFTPRFSQHKWSSWHLHRALWPSQLSCGGEKQSCSVEESANMTNIAGLVFTSDRLPLSQDAMQQNG